MILHEIFWIKLKLGWMIMKSSLVCLYHIYK